jgi:hypothetical protein
MSFYIPTRMIILKPTASRQSAQPQARGGGCWQRRETGGIAAFTGRLVTAHQSDIGALTFTAVSSVKKRKQTVAKTEDDKTRRCLLLFSFVFKMPCRI